MKARPKLNLDTKFNLATNNDIVGGNSGSPLINARGEIVGLVFDGNIHSISGSYWFDADMNRSVGVHPEYIRAALPALALLLAGTFIAGTSTARAQQPEPPPAPPLEIGAVAPDFELPGATRFGVLREPVRLSDFKGKTVVLAFFFRARTRG